MTPALAALGILTALAGPPRGSPLHRPAPPRADLQVPEDARELGALLRARGWAHSATRFRVRELATPRRGRLLILRETWRGRLIAGARLALRVDERGALTRVVRRSLAPALALPTRAAPLDEDDDDAQLWWPQGDRLVPARVVDDPPRWEAGRPTQTRRYVELRSGRELARQELVDELDVPLRGWLESPLTTPTPQSFTVALLDQQPIALESDVVRVLQCGWSAADEDCVPFASPLADAPDGFPADLPELTDAVAHADPADPYAPIQMAIHAARLVDDLERWGWDPFVWDEIDCGWQEVAPEDCRLLMHANVLQQDEQGVFPYPGAFYNLKRGVFMGQGINADTAFDGDIIVHELGHHIVWGVGTAEPIELADDGARRRVDWGALNEGSADVFASLMGQNERIYDYFTEREPGSYVDHRARDVSIPFRCPENVVGEVHMEGRIWVSAIHTIRQELAARGLADRDAFGATWLTALALVRHVPRERGELFGEAAALLAEELRLSLGSEAGDIADAVLAERGLSECDHVLDLRDELALPLLERAPLDARFMVFTSHRTKVAPADVAAHPYAPPLQHRVALGEDEGGVRLRARPTLWRPARPVDRVDFTLGLLAKLGDGGVSFVRDPETKLTSNDAALRVESADIDADGWLTLELDGLTPGQTYSLALVSLSALDGDNYVIERVRWELLPAPADDAVDTEDLGTGTDSGQGASDQGCGCASASGPRRAPPGWWLLALALWRRRRIT
ncbi:MAG: hypothetical protein H6713_31935 [Myxococcales bacterium]|nr:hypothetical protein [Myxococcales bacterium]